MYSEKHNKESVYKDIHKQIRTGKLAPGDHILEKELCSKYGLSRTPMREVLWNLEKEGLLIPAPKNGYLVRELNLQEIMEIFQAREAVEGMAAYLVSHLRNEDFFNRLKEFREALESLSDDEMQAEGPKLGAQLHTFIIENANNGILFGYYKMLHTLYSLTVNISSQSREIESKSRESHLAIIKAIEDRNGELAEKLMREHLRETCRNIAKVFYPNLIE